MPCQPPYNSLPTVESLIILYQSAMRQAPTSLLNFPRNRGPLSKDHQNAKTKDNKTAVDGTPSQIPAFHF